MKKVSILLMQIALVCFMSIDVNAQGIDPDLISKAKMFGITDEQIASEMSKLGGGASNLNTNTGTQSNTPTYEERKDTLNVTPKKSIEELTAEAIAEAELEKLSLQPEYGIYGRELFNKADITYEPNLNIPTPIDYTLSAGDEVIVNVWGDSEIVVKERISPEGLIYIKGVGPIQISGLTIAKATNKITETLSRTNETIGVTSHVTFSLGQIRSIKINIVGEVEMPGTYTVTSLATLFHALHISGGTTEIGDLRNIEVFRNSKKVAALDVYSFISNGSTKENIILKDGDVVVVPTYKIKALIEGEIKRPMYYLLKEGESVQSLINYAGGYSEDAYQSRIKLFRKTGEYNEVKSIESSNFASADLQNGDLVIIEKAKDEFINTLAIEGSVWYPGDFELDDNTNSLSKLIEYAGGLKGDDFSRSSYIERRNPDYTYSVINFNPAKITMGAKDITLQNYDKVVIPSVVSLTEKYTISVTGEVNAPTDTIIFKDGMHIEDAIVQAKGLKESASLSVINVSRRVRGACETNYTPIKSENFSFKINDDLSIDSSSEGFTLEPYDIISVRRSPHYKVQTNIFIEGEVIFPGSYAVETEDTYLSDVINIAKGATPSAYLKGASLIRTIDANNENMQGSLENLARSSSEENSVNVNSNDIKKYSVAIDLEKALLDPTGKNDLLLEDGDRILIPKKRNTVMILGEVYYQNSTIYAGKRLKQYISKSGGYTKTARKHPFVIYQNGNISTTKRVFFVKKYPDVEPGSIIIVPGDKSSKLSPIEILSLITGTTSVATSMATLGVSLAR